MCRRKISRNSCESIGLRATHITESAQSIDAHCALLCFVSEWNFPPHFLFFICDCAWRTFDFFIGHRTVNTEKPSTSNHEPKPHFRSAVLRHRRIIIFIHCEQRDRMVFRTSSSTINIENHEPKPHIYFLVRIKRVEFTIRIIHRFQPSQRSPWTSNNSSSSSFGIAIGLRDRRAAVCVGETEEKVY